MDRVMIIGCCGAGKSTFSKRLSQLTGLEVIHLDQYYWKPNWEESDKEEWTDLVKKLAGKPQWIMDGNYGGTMDIRMARADTIIYLDYSTAKCLWRITKRILKGWDTAFKEMAANNDDELLIDDVFEDENLEEWA